MSFAERGIYLELLIEQWDNWRHKSLPSDRGDLARLIGATQTEVEAAWPALDKCFIRVDKNRIRNVKLERVRRNLLNFKRDRVVAGRAGGLARARNYKKTEVLGVKQNQGELDSAIAKPDFDKAKCSSSSSTSSSSSSSTSSSNKDKSSAAKPAARQTAARELEDPEKNVGVIAKLAHEFINQHGDDDTLKDRLKDACAAHHISYNATVIGKAIDSARVVRRLQKQKAPAVAFEL